MNAILNLLKNKDYVPNDILDIIKNGATAAKSNNSNKKYKNSFNVIWIVILFMFILAGVFILL